MGSTRTLLIRVPSVASSAGRSVIAASTETAGISMPPIPIERMNGSGRTIIESSPTATVEPETITERPAWVIVSTIAVSTSSPVAELVAEAEDHQQRVVDRDAEPDERDQELDDDRDVRDVGQRPDEREGVQDRGDGDGDRHQHRRQGAEDEEEDHERAGAADQRLGQHARAVAAARGRGLEREEPRQVGLHAGRGRRLQRRPGLGDVHRGGEVRVPGRVDLREGGVPVASRRRRGCPVDQYEETRESGLTAAAAAIALAIPACLVMSPVVWKTATQRRLLAGAEHLAACAGSLS